MNPHINLAVAYGLPPDTPLNLVVSRGLNMHAINRARAVKKEYDANNQPAASDAKPVGRENQDELKAPPPPHT
jgi:hypothetical protein